MKIAILGIGNILLRDDGIGIHVINELTKIKLKNDIDLIDGGTCIFDLLNVFIENNKVIVIDSLKGGNEPGTIYKITPRELTNYIKANSSLHDVQILDIIKSANLMGYFPEIIIIGIEPAEIFYDMNLSELLKKQVSEVCKTVLDELEEETNKFSRGALDA